ncbi:MAG: S49 family peptidase [Hyphomicrobium sp.]|uniref:S49 family peptidase n=1 Tax=Hyphomicrobium sp. TaxID=82 RepID=UPI003D0A9384
MGWFNRGPVVPVLRLSGAIGMAAPLRPGLSITALAGPIERAFSMSRAKSVAVVVNSPGGSPVQSSLLFRRLRQLAEEKDKRLYVFCEDVAASGGYYVALAGDEIHADASSIVGSIGVISASFGLDKAIEKLGIERRVYTAGANKGALDPFQPEKADDIERLKAVQRNVHDVFIGVVKDRRQGRLKGADGELFSGAFWSATDALDLGLIDGISDVRTRMREVHGPNVRLRAVPIERGWLAAWFRRLPSTGGGGGGEAPRPGLAFADDLVSAVEIRALWSRFGL